LGELKLIILLINLNEQEAQEMEIILHNIAEIIPTAI
jgi:hypothetical protein